MCFLVCSRPGWGLGFALVGWGGIGCLDGVYGPSSRLVMNDTNVGVLGPLDLRGDILGVDLPPKTHTDDTHR